VHVILPVHVWWIEVFRILFTVLADLEVSSCCPRPGVDDVHTLAVPIAVMARKKPEETLLLREPVL
jgi:hypothetical protein